MKYIEITELDFGFKQEIVIDSVLCKLFDNLKDFLDSEEDIFRLRFNNREYSLQKDKKNGT